VPELSFSVEGAEVVPYAAAPMLMFKLRVTNALPDEPITTIALRAQIQIEATRRQYSDGEAALLRDLFGERARWSQTLKGMLWTFATTVVAPFTGSTTADLPVPCTFDFNVAATKYFNALEAGDVPLNLMFSGTVFYETPDGLLQVTQVPWDREAAYRLPIAVWQAMMDHYYPNLAWLTLRKDVFDRLYQYKLRHGLTTWENVLQSLLSVESEAEGL